jgi:hypothetical protein
MSQKDKISKVDNLLRSLQLSKCQNTLVITFLIIKLDRRSIFKRHKWGRKEKNLNSF